MSSLQKGVAESERWLCFGSMSFDTRKNRIDNGLGKDAEFPVREFAVLLFIAEREGVYVPFETVYSSSDDLWEGSPETARHGIAKAINRFNNLGYGFAWIESDGGGYIFRINHGQSFNRQLWEATTKKYGIVRAG